MVQDKVKKVKAFPIAASVIVGATTFPAQIVKLTLQGFLAEVPATGLKTGEKFVCTFFIPVVNTTVNEPCVVIKHYTHWVGKEGAKVTGFLLEGHFQSLSQEGAPKIVNFLNAIKIPGGSPT